jgi:uncharacterized iron-regulated membrane protein
LVTNAQPAIEEPSRVEDAWKRWLEHPRSLWIRRAIFQVHLWMGISVGFYVLLISVSGSAVVYRRELNRKYGVRPLVSIQPGGRLSIDELKKRAQAAFPRFRVSDAYEPRRANAPATVSFDEGGHIVERYFDPYTGRDLGSTVSRMQRAVEFTTDLHDNLLMGYTGRRLNGIGAVLITVLALSGLFVWWPGVKDWRRGLKIKWDASFARLNWDSHSAVGFWCSLCILVWGISGIYFSFPDAFNSFFSDAALLWLSRLHFGRMNWFTEIAWTIFGLSPAILFATGTLMWWHRKIRKVLAAPK